MTLQVFSIMLDHPITVVLNVFHTCKNTGLKVYKFMSNQNQEEHIGHVKQSKIKQISGSLIFISCKVWLHTIFPQK